MSGKPVRTDFDYINSAMEKMQSKINNSRDVYTDKATVEASNEGNVVYSKVNNIMSGYYSAQTALLDKLNSECEAVKAAARMYKELDNRLEGETKQL